MLIVGVMIFGTGCAREESDVGTPTVPEGGGIDSTEAPADGSLHPAFSLTRKEFEAIIDDLPDEQVARITSASTEFLDQIDTILDQDPIITRLVDKKHLLPPDYIPEDIVPLDQYADTLTLNREDLSLREIILPDLFAMIEAAAADEIVLDLSSTYRSYEYQEWLFQYWVDQLGLEEAERVSARPGSSQHQLGTTVDFGSIEPEYAGEPGGRWLADHAWRYGFSLSYPEGNEGLTGYSFEPWHYRWISQAATILEREFFGGSQQQMLEFLHQNRSSFQDARVAR